MTKEISRRDFLFKTTLMGGSLASVIRPVYGQSVYNPSITELTQFVRGKLPILIVAPHGGTELVNGIESRRNTNRPVSNFSYYGAVWTREICIQISRTIKRLSGSEPYMVLNLAHRRYVDVNREESDAYEAILNAPRIYWEYHDFINEYVNRMNVLYQNPILIEISGQSDLPNLIVRRTLNGQTMKRLINQHGTKIYQQKLNAYTEAYNKTDNIIKKNNLENLIQQYELQKDEKIFQYGNEAYTGSNSLIGEIQKRGYRINPDLYETENEQSLSIAGDYTLERYGTRDINNINAIQLVVGSEYRRTSNYLQTGRDFGNAIWAFAQRYIIENN